jgi:two-component system NtrC family response regulator
MAESAVVTAHDLDLAVAAGSQSLSLRDARRRAEKSAIELALSHASGNISKTASLLGISRPTLYDLIEEIGLELPRAQEGAKRDIERTTK